MAEVRVRPLVVWRAGVYWDAVEGTDRRLVSRLSRWVDVVWVDPPQSITSAGADRRLRPRTEVVLPGVRRLQVTAPPLALRRAMLPVTERIMRGCLAWVLRDEARPASAVVSTTPSAGLRIVDAGRRLYYATDDFTAGAVLMGRDDRWMRTLEERRLAEADVVGAVSPVITAKWPRHPAAFVLPNGVNAGHYGDVDRVEWPEDVPRGGAVAGLVGQLSSRIDLDLLEALAGTELRLLLVGPRIDGWGGERFDALVGRPNVTWVGAKSYEELPAYLRAVDVGVTPYVDSEFNRASSPLKTLEYLAAGRPALSTPLPAVTALGTDLVACAQSPADFAAEATRIASQPREPEDVRRRHDFARSHDWDSRARELLTHLGLAVTADER